VSINDVLTLERIEKNIFRGQSQDVGTPQVFGGQVLAQALQAAQTTVPEDRFVHSVHAYFLNRGDFEAPIIYEVDRSRDGRSFSARRVVAIQHGRPIFTLSGSFHITEPGLEYAEGIAMPAVPGVDNTDYKPWRKKLKEDPEGGTRDQKIRAIKRYALASVDHAIWFHREFDLNNWLLYKCQAISTSNARGLAKGSFYNEAGLLVATTMQEGLIRPIKKNS